MEDEHPSLPSNYVSLVQLQERWLKEQQRKQREKEEQERKREEDQQKQIRKENGDKGLDNYVSVSRRPFRRNRRNLGARDRQTVEESNPNLEVSKIEAVVSQDEPKKDELKERVKKKKKKNKRRKPRVEENLAGVTSQMAPVEKLQVFVTERNGESEQIESKFRRNGGDQGVNHKVLEPKVQIDQAATLARNVEELSLNDRKECMRSAGKTNAGHRQYSRGSERADRWKLSKQRDCNLVWVKKGERTGTDITEVQSSGTSVKAGMDKKKRPGHSKQKYSASRD